MPLMTLKVDVDTYRGTREGVPALVRMLREARSEATFLFSLGPDHTGWALRRALRPGFLQKVSRTSVVEHYGLKTLMYGVLLPAPDIGRECDKEMRSVASAGFECGIHAWDHVVWHDNVRRRDTAWTCNMMKQAHARFISIFGLPPRTHGAAGWQMNSHAFTQLDAFGFDYASDGRACLNHDGTLCDPSAGPYQIINEGSVMSCIQLPTTLPTLDEMLGRVINGRVIDTGNIAETILGLTAAPRDHVFTLHAELEGQKFAPIFQQLLAGWKTQGYEMGSMATHHARLGRQSLPTAEICWGALPGRSGEMILQPQGNVVLTAEA